jgi:hypothetical protein
MSSSPMNFPIPTWKSIYIPVIPNDLTIDGNLMTDENTLRDYFENKAKYGVVDRIDFVCRQNGPESNIVKTSAFVHFNTIFENQSNLSRCTEIENGDYKTNGYAVDSKYRFFVRESSRVKGIPFISIKVNYKPLPTVTETMNVHQLVAVKIELENKVKEMGAEIAELKAKLAQFTTCTETSV